MGYYIPSERVPNKYFHEVNGLTGDWIFQRTGIKTRSKASQNEDCHTMGVNAVRNAISKLPYNEREVDLIIAANYSPLDTVGTLAHVVQKEFHIQNAKVFYMSSACSSFANAIESVECYFAANKATKALIICSEHNTFYSNESDPQSGHLWGDAAVAMFLSKEKYDSSEPKVLDVYTRGLGHIGKGPAGVYLRPRKEGIVMPDGKDVFINACKYMVEVLHTLATNNDLSLEQLNYIICHQANLRIVSNIEKQLNLPTDRFLNNITELGNTGSASSVLVMAQNMELFAEGDFAAITVFGGGYSCGGFLIRF